MLRKWFATPMRVSKEYQKTRSKCLFILIPFYSLPKYKDLWTLLARVCPCMRCDAGDVIVVMSVSWSVPGPGSLNKVMRSKLNSAMSVPVWAMSRATAHTKTVLLQYLSKSKCFQNRHSAWCIWLWSWMKWLKCKRKSGTFSRKCPFLFCILNKLLQCSKHYAGSLYNYLGLSSDLNKLPQCSKHYAGSLYVYCGPLSLKSAALCSITRRLLLIDEDKVGPCQPCRQRDGQEFADSQLFAKCKLLLLVGAHFR